MENEKQSLVERIKGNMDHDTRTDVVCGIVMAVGGLATGLVFGLLTGKEAYGDGLYMAGGAAFASWIVDARPQGYALNIAGYETGYYAGVAIVDGITSLLN